MRKLEGLAIASIIASLLVSCVGAPVAEPSPTATVTVSPTERVVTSPTPIPTPTPVPQPPDVPAVSFARADFERGVANGVTASGALALADRGLATGVYDDPYGAPKIAFESGTWTSEWTAVSFPFDELIASWNADTPGGTWIRVEAQARGAGRDTKFYTVIVWASGDGDIHRTSIAGQKDVDGDVNVDTFVRAKDARPLDTYRLRVTLYRRAGFLVTPTVRLLGAMTSATFKHEIPSPFSGGAIDLSVPMFSQEIHKGEFPEYDGGGEAWCSPTSTAMVLAFHGAGPSEDELANFPGDRYDDPQVDFAARATYEWNYKGAGNWPANVAYATRFGLEGFVTRLRSLNEAQRFVEASIPLVASITGKLPGLLFGETNGHLLVIRGFDRRGNVITNDPAAPTDEDTHKTYGRADFERVWLGGSGGTVYVIYPRGKPLPPNVPDLPANW